MSRYSNKAVTILLSTLIQQSFCRHSIQLLWYTGFCNCATPYNMVLYYSSAGETLLFLVKKVMELVLLYKMSLQKATHIISTMEAVSPVHKFKEPSKSMMMKFTATSLRSSILAGQIVCPLYNTSQ